MDVSLVANVSNHRHGRAGDLLPAHQLRLANLGRHPLVWRDLHELERELALSPSLPPVLDHGWEQLLILSRPARVGFALIPDGPGDGVGLQRNNHSIVEAGGPTGAAAWVRRRARGRGEPFARGLRSGEHTSEL